MRFNKLIPLIIVLCLLAVSATFGQENDGNTVPGIAVSQIDTSQLLTRQTVHLFISVLDAAGIPVNQLGSKDFQISESADESTWISVPVTNFSAHASDEGITYFLLIDNSGSMYETIDGQSTDRKQDMRMTQAQEALKIFLRSMNDTRDKVQLAAFNSFFNILSENQSNPQELVRAVDRITQPEKGSGEGWTELYYAVNSAIRLLADVPGRKTIVVLSDGENYPYLQGSGKPHPEFGEREYTADFTAAELEKAGISLFSIRFGQDIEENLTWLSDQSGGRVFDTLKQDELANIYLDIRNQILREYKISYRATMTPSEKRTVRISYKGDAGTFSTERSYFAGTLIGMPAPVHPVLLLLPFLLAIAGLIVLSRLGFTNKQKSANLEVLEGSRFSKTIAISQNKTVIGSADSDDITLVDAQSARPSHATIIYDPDDNSYSVESEDPVKVNNQKTTKRKLDPGDVINVGGSMVVFDTPEQEAPPSYDAPELSDEPPVSLDVPESFEQHEIPEPENLDFEEPDFETPDLEESDIDTPDMDMPDFDEPSFDGSDFDEPDFDEPDLEEADTKPAGGDFDLPDFDDPDFDDK